MALDKIGRYQIKQELGQGGMATVYQAFDPEFERDVAVKVLPREFLHDPNFRARFKREAKIIATLEHPAIVPVYDYGEEEGQPYIVMRLMPGGSLADQLQRGPLTLPEAARLFEQMAPALDEAHRRGIIHRDLKPANILFDSRRQPYISDFGIAKMTQSNSTFTGNAIVGTPAYMSPEQARGDTSVDARSDIYAFGAILFETLTGQLPYDADTPMGLAVKHITEPLPRLSLVAPNLPLDCETIIQRAMAKDRNERFTSAGDLAAALSAALAPTRPNLPPHPVAQPPEARARNWPVWVLALIVVAVFGCGLLVVGSAGGLLLALRGTPITVATEIVSLPTATQPPPSPVVTDAPSPTLTSTPAPSATATAQSVSVIPTRTPLATAAQPRISDFRACLDPCLLDGSNATTTFPEATERIHLFWRFENIPIGATYIRTWSNRNEEWVRYACSWPGPTSGENSVTLSEPDGLRSGAWQLTISIDGQTVFQTEISVAGSFEFWFPAGIINRCFID